LEQEAVFRAFEIWRPLGPAEMAATELRAVLAIEEKERFGGIRKQRSEGLDFCCRQNGLN
jgi:hypothetical protein